MVVEPGQRSIQTANTVKEMAKGLGVKKVFVVAYKVRGEEDLNFLKKELSEMDLIGHIGFNHEIMESDIEGVSPFSIKSAVEDVMRVKENLEKHIE